jgi:hypothetical protein
MKRTVLIAILVVGLTATYSFAQMSHQGMMGSGMMGSQGTQQTGETPAAGGYNPYQMMGPGMMGYGMGPGMMGYGGHMMGRCGMMGNYGISKEYSTFLDETRSPRKELHMKKFEYSEALRDPDTKRENIIEMEKQMRELQNQIYKKSLK